MEFFLKNSKFRDWFFVPSLGLAKGLAITWDNNLEMKLLSENFNVCHLESKIGDTVIEMVCVYGAVEADEKLYQWSYISDLAKGIKNPWFLTGNLNIILDPGEKQGGNNTSSSSKAFVTNVTDSMGLQDADYEGAPFTWSNNRSGEANICERIDRALESFQWIQLFPDTKVSHLSKVGPHHTPILFDSNPEPKKLQKPFRCI